MTALDLRRVEASYPFDYQALSADTAMALQHSAERIRLLGIRQNETIIEIGRELIAVKARLEHGQFISWIGAEFRMSVRTAQRYMGVAKWSADKNDIVSLLEPVALYALTASSTPPSVQEDVTIRIRRGDSLTTKDVKNLVTLAVAANKRADREIKRRQTTRIKKRRELDPKWAARLSKEEARREEESRSRHQLAEEAADILRKRLGPDFCRFVDLFNNISCSELRGLLFRPQPGDGNAADLTEMAIRGSA